VVVFSPRHVRPPGANAASGSEYMMRPLV